MSREADNRASPEISERSDLLSIFENGARPPKAFKEGLELEFLVLNEKTGAAAPFDGPNGIESILKEIVDRHGFSPVFNGDRLIGAGFNQAALTLEPGGQLEYSGSQFSNLHDLKTEVDDFLRRIVPPAEKRGLAIVTLGLQPVTPLREIPWVPKFRYEIMKKYYAAKGGLALDMMALTASIQVNLDYSDEAEAGKKIRLGSFLGPVVGALYANSTVEGGKLNGYASRRLNIWTETDPDRCGVPKFFVDGSFSFEKYADWALDIPMYFILRDGKYQDRTSVTFRKFLKGKSSRDVPLLSDWVSHLTTLFPDVRLKDHLEFRTADGDSPEMALALAAFWKGLIYDQKSLEGGLDRMGRFRHSDIQPAILDAAKVGLKGRMGKEKLSELARDLVSIAAKGLAEIDKRTQLNQGSFLVPLQKRAESGVSPGEITKDSWKGAVPGLILSHRVRQS